MRDEPTRLPRHKMHENAELEAEREREREKRGHALPTPCSAHPTPQTWRIYCHDTPHQPSRLAKCLSRCPLCTTIAATSIIANSKIPMGCGARWQEATSLPALKHHRNRGGQAEAHHAHGATEGKRQLQKRLGTLGATLWGTCLAAYSIDGAAQRLTWSTGPPCVQALASPKKLRRSCSPVSRRCPRRNRICCCFSTHSLAAPSALGARGRTPD